MKKIFAVALSLFLLLVLVPRAVTDPDGSSYDPMSDVNRDKTIDAYDLNRLGKAYGSTQTISTQPGKTTIYVYQLETDPPQIENARVAVIDPEHYYQAVQIEYTNSSGIIAFSLNANSNYTAIAWSKTTYNYANFTTNQYGEISVSIRLGYPSLPPDLLAITFLNKTTRALIEGAIFYGVVDQLVPVHLPSGNYNYTTEMRGGVSMEYSLFIIGPWTYYPATEPGKSYVASLLDSTGLRMAWVVYTPDEKGTANIITYV